MDHVKQALIRTASILYKLDQLPELIVVERAHESFMLSYIPVTGYEEVALAPCDTHYKEHELFAMLGRLKATSPP